MNGEVMVSPIDSNLSKSILNLWPKLQDNKFFSDRNGENILFL